MSAIVGAVSAIAGVIGGAGSFFGNPLVKIAGGIALQMLGSKAKKKKKKSSSSSSKQASGTQLDTTVGGSQSREIGTGLFATAGQEISPAITFGPENKTAVKVILLSDFRIDGVNRVAINNIWCDLTGDNNTERGFNVTGETSAFVRIKLYKGDPNQSADAYLVKNSGGRWTANHKGAGLSYAIVSVDYDAEKMTSFPTFLFECRGVAYDPRFDSSVGGNGDQRYDDPKTWQYSDNPIVQAYTYSRGFHINGQLIAGKDMPSRDLPLPAWIAAMNVCDETIAAESNQKRYRASAIFVADGNVSHRDNLQPLLDACAGDLVERVNGDIPLVGMTRPIVAQLNEDDLIIGENASFVAKRSRSELINAVFGSYNEPEKTWSSVAYPAQIDVAAQNADGERHARQVDFKAVFSAQQAARLAQTLVRENRFQAKANVVVRPRWVVLEVGDWIEFTFKDFGKRIYEVQSRSLAPLANGARNVTLSLQEVGSGIYDNSVDIPALPAVISPSTPALQQFPDGLRVVAATAESPENKRKLPVIVVSWDQPTDIITVRGVLIELWKTSEPDSKIQFQARQPQNSFTISGCLLPHEAYSVRATVIPEPYRVTLWSDTKNVTTLDEDYDTGQILNDVADLNKWLTYDRRSIREENELIGLIASDASAGGYELSRSIKRELTVSLGKARAEFTEQITVAVSKTSALAAKLETLEAEVNGNIATAFNEIKAQVDTINGKVTANAQQLSFLNAQVDNVASSITIKSEVSSTATDGWARHGIVVKTGDGNNWSTGAFYIDVKPSQSRLVLLADQVVISNGDLTTPPFSFANGVLRSNAADIGTVTAGELNINNRFKVARDGTVEISGYAGSGRSVLTNSRYEVYDNAGRLRVQLGVW